MLLFLRLQDGRTEELKVPSSEPVSSLTQLALSAFSLPASSVLFFVYKGRPLPSQGSLSDAGLTSECTIIVTVASPSGTAAAASVAVPTYPLRHFLAAALAHDSRESSHIQSICAATHSTYEKERLKARVFCHLYSLFTSEVEGDHSHALLTSTFDGSQPSQWNHSQWVQYTASLHSALAQAPPEAQAGMLARGWRECNGLWDIVMARAGLILDCNLVPRETYAEEELWLKEPASRLGEQVAAGAAATAPPAAAGLGGGGGH